MYYKKYNIKEKPKRPERPPNLYHSKNFSLTSQEKVLIFYFLYKINDQRK